MRTMHDDQRTHGQRRSDERTFGGIDRKPPPEPLVTRWWFLVPMILLTALAIFWKAQGWVFI